MIKAFLAVCTLIILPLTSNQDNMPHFLSLESVVKEIGLTTNCILVHINTTKHVPKSLVVIWSFENWIHCPFFASNNISSSGLCKNYMYETSITGRNCIWQNSYGPKCPYTHGKKKTLTAGVMQRNDPPLQNDPWVISLRRGMTWVIILYREMTPDRRKRSLEL